MLTRRMFLMAGIGSGLAVLGAQLVTRPTAAKADVEVFKSPTCGCCGLWADHLSAAGYRVHRVDLDDLAPVKARLGVPPHLHSCHTAVVDGYVVEGHVPAADVDRLLIDRPQATGIAVPGMPIGSPGMEQGNTRERYHVVLFGTDGESVFARH